VARYAIGDVQGCMASLERLLGLIGYAPGRDELWLTGDLVNRGPRSLDVLRWAVAQGDRVISVIGNHDLHLLARVAGVDGAKPRDTLDDVLAARDRDRLTDWLRARPVMHVDGSSALAMVHAGLHPTWTIADAREFAGELEAELRAPSWRAFLSRLGGRPPRWHAGLGGGDRWRALAAYFVRARMLHRDGRIESDYDGPPKDAPAGLVPWFRVADAAWKTHTVVFGHWAALGLDLGPRHAGLDTGCVWGNSLTAMRLDDRSVFQVKAAEGKDVGPRTSDLGPK
jgi:bis(5'-nucleosyl)-tetraphosphatase (symmetrical)